jgi:hypothetical protein
VQDNWEMAMRKRMLAIVAPTLLLAGLSFANAGPATPDSAGSGGPTSASGQLPGGNPFSGDSTGQSPSFGDDNSSGAGLAATPTENTPDSDAAGVLSTDGSGDKK